MSYAISREGEIGVGGVFAPGLPERFEPGAQFSAANAQQRAHDAAAFNLDLRIDPGQTLGPRAAHQSKQNGFSLIVERVRSCDFVCFVLPDQLSEEIVTQLSRRGLQSQMMLARELRSIGTACVERQIMFLGESAYEGFICIGLGTANLVIEVCDGKNNAQLTSRIEQQAEQRHRVRAA